MTHNRCQPTTASPTPWELIAATDWHGYYIVNEYGRDVCDLYAMSNPTAASVRNGGTSYPVHFTDAEANAKLIVEAVNSHAALKARIAELEAKVAELHEASPNCLFYKEQAEYWKQIAREDRAKAEAYDRCSAKLDCLSRGELKGLTR